MHPLNAYHSMASPADRAAVRGSVLEVWHLGDGPVAHWCVLLGGGDAVDGAREQRCGLCDEQTPMWHHEAWSEALRRDPLHAALRATGRRATGNGLLRSN